VGPSDDGGGDGRETPDVSAVYGALVQLAVHGQENKWWMLYILLMFNSILLLSCAAIFATQHLWTEQRVLLCMFSLAGALIALCWIAMASDYVRASDLYGAEVVVAEKRLPPQFPKPLTKRADQRAGKTFLGTSKFITIAIPVVLILLYAGIMVLAWRHP
jgi:hypothetical protein